MLVLDECQLYLKKYLDILGEISEITALANYQNKKEHAR